MQDYDALVVGGGSGLTAAYYAEAAGKDVAVVEEGPLGGTCVNRGCIPTKTLIQSAKVAQTVRDAGTFGVDATLEGVDGRAVFDRMRTMREENVRETDRWIEGSDRIALYRDRARFVDDRTVEVGGERIRGEKVFVCTGARPLIPPIDGIQEVDVHTNRTVLDEMKRTPERVVVVGGGYVGLEFAHFFDAVGTDVTVVDPGLPLSREDEAIAERLTEEVREYVDLRAPARATALHGDGSGVEVTLEPEDGAEETVAADEVMIAAGRRPNTDDLGLGETGVETDERGWIQVDASMQTTNPDVYAYGDVIGQAMFKHTSSFEGEVAWRASQGEDVEMDYAANPHAIFTRPPVGSVGLTEAEAEERGHDVETATVGYQGSAKGHIVDGDGFAKALVDGGSREILGFHMIGPEAPDLIHEVVVAMTCGDGTVDNVVDAIHVHPTLPEIVHTAFGQLV
jgi:dihydrolipoamide dehydrogenase